MTHTHLWLIPGRRSVTRWLAALAIASLFAALGCSSGAVLRAPDGPKPGRSTAGAVLSWISADDAGLDTRIHYYDNGYQVVVFGAHWSAALADQAIAELRAETRSPITHVVVLSAHPSQWGGLDRFRAVGARVVAFDRVARELPGASRFYRAWLPVALPGRFGGQLLSADPRVDERVRAPSHVLRLDSGEQIELKLLSAPGPAGAHAVAWIESANALVVGDLLAPDQFAWLGGVPRSESWPRLDLQSWVVALRSLKTLFPAATSELRVSGSAGEPGVLGERVSAQIHELYRMEGLGREFIAREVARGMPESDLRSRLGLKLGLPVAHEVLVRFRKYVTDRIRERGTPEVLEAGSLGLLRGLMRTSVATAKTTGQSQAGGSNDDR